MKNCCLLFLIGLYAFSLWSCNGNKKSSEKGFIEEHPTTFIDSAVNQTQDSFFRANAYHLNWRAGVSFKLKKLLPLASTLQTKEDLFNYYEKYVLLEKEVNEDLFAQYKSIQNDSIKKLFIDSASSLATQLRFSTLEIDKKSKTPAIYIHLDSAIVLSKSTKGEEDEVYFSYLKKFYANSVLSSDKTAAYIYTTKNKTQVIKVGDYTFQQLLQQLNYNIVNSTLYHPYYVKLNDQIRDDLLIKTYYYNKSKVLEEYYQLIEIKSEVFEEERIKQRIEDIKLDDKQFQFSVIN